MNIMFDITGCAPYIVLIALSLVAHLWVFKKNPSLKKELVVFILLGIAFFVVEAIRYNVGSDYMIPYASDLELMYMNSGNPRTEILFRVLTDFVVFARGDIVFMMALCAAFIIPAFWIFIEKNIPRHYWFFAIFLFVGLTIFYATMNAVRQYMAIAVLIFGYPYLKDEKYFRYIIFNIIAILFHTSALVNLILLPMVFIYKKLKSRKIFLLLSLSIYTLSLICIFFDARNIFRLLSPILPDRYTFYLDGGAFNDKNPLALLKLIVPNITFIVSTVYYTKMTKLNKDYKIWYVALLIYTFISNAFYGINVFIRLTWYFDFYLIPLITYLLCYLKLHDRIFHIRKLEIKLSSVITASIVIYLISMNIVSVFIRNNHGVVPYRTIFDKTG